MSDASLPHCEKCQQPECACDCPVTECESCGCKLSKAAIRDERDVCFDCYCDNED
jgi:hypothetical protein